MQKIGCIIVTYNPDLSLLSQVIESISNQVDTIYISDNSINGLELRNTIKYTNNILIAKMHGNMGIGATQNAGVCYFLKEEYSYIFMLDQDSIVEPLLIHTLLADLTILEKSKINVGAISPLAINKEDGKAYNKSKKIKNSYNVFENLSEVSELMNSATLIPSSSFLQIGYFDEQLFIDGVDHEWCWRAKSLKNLRFFISEKAFISHQLGEGDRFFVLRNVAIPTPFRTYYQFRNYFILARRNYVPTYWKLSNGFKYFIKLFYYPIFIKPRREYFKNILKGIKDGLSTN